MHLNCHNSGASGIEVISLSNRLSCWHAQTRQWLII